MSKAQASVEELVSMVETGQLRLPEMQRRYVWRATRVRDLLDSLYRGYPSGTILIWDTEDEVPLQEFSIEQAKNPYPSTRLLLDGQQRITSLAAVIRGIPVKVRGRKKPIDLLFNLDHPEGLSFVTEVEEESEDDEAMTSGVEPEFTEDELQRRFQQMTFLVATNKLANQPNWVKVSEVFTTTSDSKFLARMGIERIDDPRYEKYSERLARLRSVKNYEYRMDILERTMSYDEVTEIFVRVNSLGAKLRSSDLALAQITAKWPNSLALFESFQNEYSNAGFDLDLSMFLRAMVAMTTHQSRFKSVGGLPREQLERGWKSACEGMNFAINMMRSNMGIDSPALLSSPFILIAVAYYGHKRDYKLSPQESLLLRQWILLANAKARYSRGSSETILDQDIALLRDGGAAADLLERLRLQVGRLDVTPGDLEGRNQRSALFKTMFLAFREAGAKDWFSQLEISVDHVGVAHNLQFHHIFPKALLKGVRTTKDIDDIANLAFIAGRTNRKISANPPSEYLPPLMEQLGGHPFVAQCIPSGRELLSLDQYEQFLAERRRLIAERLNAFLGVV